ncbi:MAG: hypothetical protein IGS03_00210 [Candidatus Sericytochromatia bacterium]|nr:hypothetical protein [Candidatus Sericytochromatia bacterium]
MPAPELSIFITNNPYLNPEHLWYQVEALNAQSDQRFQVFYLNQAPDPEPLHQALQQARYTCSVIPLPFPWLANTCCWDMVSVTGRLLAQPVHGKWWTYLHKECLPAPDFVEKLLQGLAAAEAELGSDCVFRLNQLRCEQDLQALKGLGLNYLDKLAASQPVTWIDRVPFVPGPVYRQAPWSEDAFALSVDWSRRSGLFNLRIPLFFQDLFDVFYQLPQLPAFAHIPQVHLGQPVIYHLNHPRAFYEYRREFLQQVRQYPKIFGHLALYELAQDDFDYQEDFTQQQRVIPQHLHQFVRYMRYSERGTVTLWLKHLSF